MTPGTPSPFSQFSPSVAQALHRCGQVMRQTEQGDVHGLYQACRAALTHVADVDTCYIGHYRTENRLIIPYFYDRGQSGAPDVTTFGEFGLSHWLRTWASTYTYGQDQGRLIHAGRPSEESPVRDAVVAPLFEVDGTVSGMLAALSSSPGHFNPERVAAVQWVARRLSNAINRDQEDDDDLALVQPSTDAALNRSGDLVHAISDRLRRLRHEIHQSALTLGSGDAAAAGASLSEIAAMCERFDTELSLIATDPGRAVVDFPRLTEREVVITRLIVRENLSNAQIAARLVIAEKTVKTHLSHVFRKVGVTQRSELQYVVAPEVLGPRNGET
ncbi:MAG: LuxR C-terminal-related transcriptional regulator [Allobranchiibius sp.]